MIILVIILGNGNTADDQSNTEPRYESPPTSKPQKILIFSEKILDYISEFPPTVCKHRLIFSNLYTAKNKIFIVTINFKMSIFCYKIATHRNVFRLKELLLISSNFLHIKSFKICIHLINNKKISIGMPIHLYIY